MYFSVTEALEWPSISCMSRCGTPCIANHVEGGAPALHPWPGASGRSVSPLPPASPFSVGRNRQAPTDSQRGGEQAGGHEDRSRGGIRQRGDLNEPIGLELDIEEEAPEKIGACKGRGRLRDDDLVCLLFEDGIAEIRGNRL